MYIYPFKFFIFKAEVDSLLELITERELFMKEQL